MHRPGHRPPPSTPSAPACPAWWPRCPSTRTRPAMTSACAFSRDSARPCSASQTSSARSWRSRVALDDEARERRSSAPRAAERGDRLERLAQQAVRHALARARGRGRSRRSPCARPRPCRRSCRAAPRPRWRRARRPRPGTPGRSRPRSAQSAAASSARRRPRIAPPRTQAERSAPVLARCSRSRSGGADRASLGLEVHHLSADEPGRPAGLAQHRGRGEAPARERVRRLRAAPRPSGGRRASAARRRPGSRSPRRRPCARSACRAAGRRRPSPAGRRGSGCRCGSSPRRRRGAAAPRAAPPTASPAASTSIGRIRLPPANRL